MVGCLWPGKGKRKGFQILLSLEVGRSCFLGGVHW